jgi:acetoin:2,6-dichlorophenolindophenol oxidoreductase subunit alpha
MDIQAIFRKMCLIRHFELQVAQAFERQLTPGPVYLSVGQEAPSATVSMLTQGHEIFSQHRGHSVYLAHGGKPEALRDELLGLASGCCQGRGGSPCVQDLDVPMYGHHGLIGENIPIGTGHAFATRKPTVIYFGDAAAEEDYALTSFGFAATHALPVLYVCEDNDLSILTPIDERRSWQVYELAEAMGLATAHVKDDPGDIYEAARDVLGRLPAFLNIQTCRHLWHMGVGTDGAAQWDRLDEYRDKVPDAQGIENGVKIYVEGLWQEQLQTQ